MVNGSQFPCERVTLQFNAALAGFSTADVVFPQIP